MMGLDFPLILVLATGITGAIWLLEKFWLGPRRAQYMAESMAESVAESVDKAPSKRQPVIVEYAISFFPVLALVLVFRSFLYEPFQIPTGSMIPTLAVGDFVLVNKNEYGIRLPVLRTKVWELGSPQRGDIMVFTPAHEDQYFIKRVVGTPGDRVRYVNKVLYINGEEQTQTFVAQFPPVHPRVLRFSEQLGESEHQIERHIWPDLQEHEWVIPEDGYFMMGDNRDNSNDSRAWGVVHEDEIVGKAVAIWLHKEPGLHLPEFSRNRWLD